MTKNLVFFGLALILLIVGCYLFKFTENFIGGYNYTNPFTYDVYSNYKVKYDNSDIYIPNKTKEMKIKTLLGLQNDEENKENKENKEELVISQQYLIPQQTPRHLYGANYDYYFNAFNFEE